MGTLKSRKNLISGILCGILLICTWLIYFDIWGTFRKNGAHTVTIGVFSNSYWEVQNGYSYRILEDAAAVFEKQHPGVQVEYVSGILKEDYPEWLAEQLLSGNAPDLFFIASEDFNDFAEIGALKDLRALIEKDEEFDSSVFYSSAYAYGQYNGIPCSLPYECAPKLMFVNKSILDKEGLQIPRKEWTWDEFYDICKKVTKDTDGNGVTDQFGTVGYTWQEAFDSNGVTLFNQTGTSCSFTGERIENALSFLEKLEALNEGNDISSKDFDMGSVVFQPMSFSEYRAYKPYPLSIKKYSDFEWECLPMPSGPEGDNISTLDTLLLAMNADTKEVAYAWEFMKILTCDIQIQSEIFEYSEGVSVVKAVTESDQTLQRLIESSGDTGGLNLPLLSDAVENAVVAPRFRNYDMATTLVDTAVNSIINGNSNISMEQIIWNRNINKNLK